MNGPRVLELRIHGIANAPPAEMLGTTVDNIERVDGDDFGSFWARRDRTDGDDIRVEAYSWGNQARSGGNGLALVGRAIVHLGWLFVLPFGLCNLAFWARREIPGDEGPPPAGQRGGRPRWYGGRGAVAIRWFALLQTLFYTAGFLSVTVDLVAVQCFRADPQLVCAALPGWFDVFQEWSRVARSALFSVAPVILMLVIYLISIRVRGSFEPNRDEESLEDDEDVPLPQLETPQPERPRRAPSRRAPSSTVSPPILGTRGFWRRARVAQTSERVHFAGVLGLVTVLLATDAVMEVVPWTHVGDLLPWIGAAASQSTIAFTVLCIGVLVLVATVVVSALAVIDLDHLPVRIKRALATGTLIAGVVVYVGWVLWATLGIPRDGPGSGDETFGGLTVAPGVIATICALIALWSLTWAYPARRIASAIVLAAAFACVIVAEAFGAGDPRLWLSVAAIGLAFVALLLGYVGHSPEERRRRGLLGWHGNGTAVAMLAALFSSMVVTSLMVIGAHAWLSTSAEDPATSDRIWREIAAAPSVELVPPDFYRRFSVSLLMILAVIVVIAVVVVATAFSRMPQLTVPTLTYPPATSVSSIRADRNRGGFDGDDLPAGYPVLEGHLSDKGRMVASARRLAALAHRGEPMLTALAVMTAVALVPLTVPLLAEALQDWVAWQNITAIAAWALGLLAVAAAAAVVANAVTTAERPLGLLWDIICFFPRAGHPFTPPCYGERTVPEIEERVEEWFAPDPAGRSVILSAHSMGAPIAIAAVFSLAGAGAPLVESETPLDEAPRRAPDVPIERIALLTYGVQLRPYFGRFFPAVFGPDVLGTPGTLGPSLVSRDPWRRQVVAERTAPPARPAAPAAPAGSSRPPTLVGTLGGDLGSGRAPRWRSLWRRTDYLGFPVVSHRSHGNPIDRGASERAARTYLWTIARHNEYLGTLQYVEARDELLAAMPRPTERRLD